MRLFPEVDETISGTAELIRSKRRTCEELVKGCLARIDEWETRIHAWVNVDREGAIRQARELDRELAEGKYRGPLHGIPVGIKDLVDIVGWPTACGAKEPAKRVVLQDAPIVRKLRDSGGVILGKTVTTQFASFDPPVTRNPWNLEHTPGGSSSGSAAGVAVGMCLGAIGSQTGGSITRPAAYCGVAGCKPTYGRVDAEGVYPLAPSLDHPGPIARTVRDLAILLDAITEPAGNGLTAACDSAQAPPQIGRLGGLFQKLAEPQSFRLLQEALERLSSSGATVREIALPPAFGDVVKQHRIVMTREIADHHAPLLAAHPEDYLPKIRGLIEDGSQVAQGTYASSREHQAGLKREMEGCFAEVDVLACLAAPGPAPDITTTGDPSFNSPWSYTGLPTVSFPIGLSSGGLPIAIQLVGRHDGERPLFAAAAWCERIVRQSIEA